MGIGDELYQTKVDAIEINCSRPKYANQLAREAAKIMELPLTSGSDSHTSFQVAVCATKFQKQINSINEIIEEVKNERCEPVYIR
jgi:histidinol phosphatase-like PHP family hydrolase